MVKLDLATAAMRRRGSTKSLSEKSTLDYEVGADVHGRPCIRITANSGGGRFSPVWIDAELIQSHLIAATQVNRLVVKELLGRMSVNMPGFLLAVLLHEGVIVRDDAKSEFVYAKPLDTAVPSGTSQGGSQAKVSTTDELQPIAKPQRKGK